MKNATILPIILLLSLGIFAAGCSGPAQTAAPVATETPLPESTPATVPSATSMPATTTTTGKVAYSKPTVNPITVTQTTRIALDNPYQKDLTVRTRTFSSPIPNCVMQTAFPGILTDSYGIDQVEPRLVSITEDEYLYFIRKNTETNQEDAVLKTPKECYGKAADPTWNFIEVRAILTPTNFHASNYTVTKNVISGGEIVAKFSTEERLVIDEDVNLLNYIIVRENEVGLVDSVKMTYTRH